MDFHEFFDGLAPVSQLAFARRAGYSVANIQIHLACPGWRRRIPSGAGFARLVAACESYRDSVPGAPTQAELFEYFYRPSRRRPKQQAAAA